jgi:hypothetical protein
LTLSGRDLRPSNVLLAEDWVTESYNTGNKIAAGSLAFDPDGTMLVTSGGNDNIYLWKLPAHAS